MKRHLLACALVAALALPGCDDDDTPAAPTTAATPTPPPPGTGPGVPGGIPPASNQPPSLVFRLRPDPPGGTAPLAMTANMCGSADPEGAAIVYEYKWGGTGGRPIPHFSFFCRDDHVYEQPGTYRAWFCVNDDRDNRVCENVTIVVSP